MKLENQVCNLELSKRLKELGVKQESLFYWCSWCDWVLLSLAERRENILKYKSEIRLFAIEFEATREWFKERCSAFTVAELGEMLPNRIAVNLPTNNIFYDLQCNKGNAGWEIYYIDMDKERKISYFYSFPTSYLFEANARAKMLIYLIENKLEEI